MKVKFSPDDSKLVSYSWGDGWLCYWDLRTRQLLWKSKTGFIEKAYEHPNLEDFGSDKNMGLLYSRSENETFQAWDAKTGRILSVSESNPDNEAFIEKGKIFSVAVDSLSYRLTNSEARKGWTIKRFSYSKSAYDVSNDGKLFAEGGGWGHAVIRITEIRNPENTYELKGGRIPPYEQTELETKMLQEQAQRRATMDRLKARRDKQAAIDRENFKKQIFITFEHYGDMTEPGQLRLLESDEPKKSKEIKSEAQAMALWLRLHNDSPLPVRIPTQSMYLPNRKCFFDLPDGQKILGLCDNREIAIWFGLEDKRGKMIPYGFDFGSAAILLPKTSVLFAVPRQILRNGNAIRFEFIFQNMEGRTKITDYGVPSILRFREEDVPNAK